MAEGYYLLTGASGLLGQYLLRDALLAEMPVAVLTRSTPQASARRRIDAVLRRWEDELRRALPRPVVLEGRLDQPDLGLEPRQRVWIAENCRAVLHCAASVTFRAGSPDGEPYRSNVEGTRRLLELCREAGIRQFHHVSTAYVSGRHAGTVNKVATDTPALRNDYERSKSRAERQVREADHLESATVYRPSIIVGDSRTGYAAAFHGIYAPLRLFCEALRRGDVPDTGRAPLSELLGLSGAERKNLVPVDWVSRVMLRIVRDESLHGRVYHLTNPVPVTVRMLERAMCAATGFAGTSEAPSLPGSGATRRDELLRHMDVYAEYLSDDPHFDAADTARAVPDLPCPRFGHEELLRLCRAAVEANFGWPRPVIAVPDFDVEDELRELLSTDSEPSCRASASMLQLEVSGPGGGVWGVVFVGGEPVAAWAGGGASCRTSVYGRSDSLAAIVRGEQSVEQALYAGRLVVCGREAGCGEALLQLQALVAYLRRRRTADEDASVAAVAEAQFA